MHIFFIKYNLFICDCDIFKDVLPPLRLSDVLSYSKVFALIVSTAGHAILFGFCKQKVIKTILLCCFEGFGI